MIHWISLLEAPRSLISDGIATLRIVLSITMMSSERHSTPSVHHRLACTSPRAVGLHVHHCPCSRLFDTEPFGIVMTSALVAAVTSRRVP